MIYILWSRAYAGASAVSVNCDIELLEGVRNAKSVARCYSRVVYNYPKELQISMIMSYERSCDVENARGGLHGQSVVIRTFWIAATMNCKIVKQYHDVSFVWRWSDLPRTSHRLTELYSRVDTDVLMEVAYSCNFLAVSDSSTCPDIGTSWCHAGIIEHFEIRGFRMTP